MGMEITIVFGLYESSIGFGGRLNEFPILHARGVKQSWESIGNPYNWSIGAPLHRLKLLEGSPHYYGRCTGPKNSFQNRVGYRRLAFADIDTILRGKRWIRKNGYTGHFQMLDQN